MSLLREQWSRGEQWAVFDATFFGKVGRNDPFLSSKLQYDQNNNVVIMMITAFALFLFSLRILLCLSNRI